MGNKKNISVRLSESDLRRLKEISRRLNIKDSDLFRFSVKLTLSRMMPLLRHDLRGIDILLTMLDGGGDLLRYFEFDSQQIDRIVNNGAEPGQRVSMDDIDMVAIATLNPTYLAAQLVDMGEMSAPGDNPIVVLRQYLHRKYCDKALSRPGFVGG